jgi:hypothetical protein
MLACLALALRAAGSNWRAIEFDGLLGISLRAAPSSMHEPHPRDLISSNRLMMERAARPDGPIRAAVIRDF